LLVYFDYTCFADKESDIQIPKNFVGIRENRKKSSVLFLFKKPTEVDMSKDVSIGKLILESSKKNIIKKLI
jgi:hypothetical protein